MQPPRRPSTLATIALCAALGALAACKPATPAHDAAGAQSQPAPDAASVRESIQAEPRRHAAGVPCTGPDADDKPDCVQSPEVQLANAFSQALEASDDPNALQEAQRRWAAKRLACRKAPDPKACVDEANRARIAELQDAQASAPKVVEFECQGSDQPFTAQFRDGDPPTAVFMLGGDRVEVPSAASASGARYTGNGVDYWEHQGEAKVDFEGTQLTCKPLS